MLDMLLEVYKSLCVISPCRDIYLTRITRRVSHVKQELSTLPEHLSLPSKLVFQVKLKLFS